jgi:dTDP-4-dehydrorhamnose reductase
LTRKAAEDFNVYATYKTNPVPIKTGQAVPLNLANRAGVLDFVTELKPEVIIHTAAINPGSQDQTMMPINAGGSRYVAEAAVAIGARLIHLSSDLLHDGKNSPYDDDTSPTPLNLYGRSKAAAEAAVAEVDPQAVIVRTSLIYGLQLMDRGTTGFVKRLNTGEPLTLFSDVIRQPIWVESLVVALLKLADIDFSGRLNVVGSQPITREEFGRCMLAWWQVDTRGLLRSGRAADISDTIPLDVRLSTSKAEQLLQMTFPGVAEVLTKASQGTS